MDSLAPGSLALALGGFSIDEDSDMAGGLPAAGVEGLRAGGAAAARAPAAAAAALVDHARVAVDRVLDAWQAPGFDPEREAEDLAAVCFAMRSAIGMSGRLAEADASALFDLSVALWVS